MIDPGLPEKQKCEQRFFQHDFLEGSLRLDGPFLSRANG